MPILFANFQEVFSRHKTEIISTNIAFPKANFVKRQ